MIGRCLRPQPGKTAVILDHVGNTQRLGHHLEEREWSLDGTPKRDREKAPSVKVCPRCFSAMPSAARECPDCGHEFVAERRELQTVDGELVEVQESRQIKVGSYVTVDDREMATKCPGEWRVSQLTDWPGNEAAFVTKISAGDPCGDGHWLKIKRLQLVSAPNHRREQATAATLDELIAIGRRRNMKNPAGWARHVMAARSLRSGKARVRQLIA
jgi:hypothetical protein